MDDGCNRGGGPLARWRTASNAALVGLFLVAIWLPLAGQMSGSSRGASRRSDAGRPRGPSWKCAGMVRFRGRASGRCKAGRMALRPGTTITSAFDGRCIRHYNLAVVKGLMPSMMAGSVGKARPEAPALVGRDGWLFSTKDEELETYRCAASVYATAARSLDPRAPGASGMAGRARNPVRICRAAVENGSVLRVFAAGDRAREPSLARRGSSSFA